MHKTLTKDEFFEKYRDPRWQKKRLEILERDDFCCQKCFDPGSMLYVHHRYYIKGKDPWNYPDEALLTLCESCHLKEKELRPSYEKGLLYALREKFLAEDVSCLSIAFHCMPMLINSDVVASIYSWALTDEDMQRELKNRYFEHCKKINKEKKQKLKINKRKKRDHENG